MAVSISELSVFLNTDTKGRLAAWQQGLVKERSKTEVHLSIWQ